MHRVQGLVLSCVGLLAASICAETPARLIGWWKLDDATNASVLADSSGFARHAAKGAGVSIVDGKFGRAARFNGTTDAWASFANPLMTNMTIAAWVYMDGIPANILPRILQVGSDVYYLMPSNGLGQFSLGCRGNNWSTSVSDPFKFVTNRWFHAAVVYRQQYTGETARVVWPTFYINGVRCGDPGTRAAFSNDIPAGTAFFGNNSSGAGGIRPLNGMMDDVRLYDAALSDREVLSLYQYCPAVVDAGASQNVCRAATALQGSVIATNPYQRDRAATLAWSTASAPAGDPPVFDTPWLPATAVTLPQEGLYRFRLTAATELGTATAEVSVVRSASPPVGNTAPSVTARWSATNTVLGASAPLEVAVSDDGAPGPARFRWTKVQGPGAVFFDNAFATNTSAFFSTNGTYLLRLEADDGALLGSADVTVNVALPSGSFTNGLVYWWRMDDDPLLKKAFDSAGTNTLALLNAAFLQPGKTGYGLREPKPDSAGQASFLPPNDEFLTFSAWLYYDNAYTNNPYMRLFNCGPNFYIIYNRTANQFDLSTTAAGGGTSTNYTWGFPDAKLTSNQWIHVAVLFDRRPAAGGSRQALYLNGTRYRSSPFTSSPAGATSFPGAAAFTSTFVIGNTGISGGTRNFDGVLDELRVFNRLITDEEALLLAADPDNNHAPVIDAPDNLSAKVARPLMLPCAVTDDGQPFGSSLAASWSVTSGDASRVLFADPSQADTSATFTKTGEYVIMLAASDGEQQAARLVTVTVQPTGTVLLLF